MARNIGTDAVIQRIRLQNQSSVFSGDPASGYGWFYLVTGSSQPLAVELDTGEISRFMTATEVNDLIASASPTTQAGSYLLSGGNVIWQSGLTFRVSAASYVIQSTQYSSAEGTIALDAADGSNPRIDVIGVDTSGTIFKVTGTPSSDPLKPDIDPHTQLELSFVLVGTGVTEPADVVNTSIYLEDAGSPTEWISTGSASFNAASTNNPRTGSKCIEVTNGANGNYIRFSVPVAITLEDQEYLILYVRNKTAWASTKSIRVEWRLNGVLVGTRATIDNGLWGFSDSLVDNYQLVAIPISVFAVPTSSYINQLYISIAGSGGNLGLYIDDMVLQGGVVQVPIGLTQEQADARYVQISNNVAAIAYTIDNYPNVIPTGIMADLEIPFGCIINRASLFADQTGSCVIDIWKDTYANYPPTDADSITASAPMSIVTGTKSQNSTLTGWTTSITAGDILRFNVDSVSLINRVTLSLKVTKT